MARQAGKPPGMAKWAAGLRRGAADHVGGGAGLRGKDFVRRTRGDIDPPLGQADGLAHAMEKLLLAVVALPATAVVELDEVRAPAFGEGAPFLRDAVKRIGVWPCRHGKAVASRWS